MSSNSYDRQQNGQMEIENSKIAQIYQRMLMGEKSALASLQKVKLLSPKETIKANNRLEEKEEEQVSPQFTQKKSMSRTQTNNRSQVHHNTVKQSPFQRIKTINQEPLEQSMLRQKQKDRQQQKLRSYIKKKVNQLRSEKQIMRNQQQKEIIDIKKTSQNRKTHTVNQSKSYDLVRRKDFIHKTAGQTKTGMNTNGNGSANSNSNANGIKQQVKKAFENYSIQQGMTKVQSSSKTNYNKHLPPLKERKKLPTEHSDNKNHNNNDDLAVSKIISRKDVITPINLADSSLKVQLKSVQTQQLSQKGEDKYRVSPSKSAKDQGSNSNNKKKPEQSRMKKISLPQMRRMREEFAVINEKEKATQLQMMEYHMLTKKQVEQVRVRNMLNFRNHERLNEMKKSLNPEPVSTTLKTIPSSLKEEHPSEQGKKKKNFVVQEEKITENYQDIKLIDEAIAKKRQEVTKVQNKLENNLLYQFWQSYNLYEYDFHEDEEDLPDILKPSSPEDITQSKLTEAYSTAMPQTKDKKWKRKAIKQYDTNRSFQEYAKSRSQFKPGQNRASQQQEASLNKIEENEQDEEDNGVNKVTVNSRLRKLLLQ